jgi:hypothetical protein
MFDPGILGAYFPQLFPRYFQQLNRAFGLDVGFAFLVPIERINIAEKIILI